jgi:hypothetical protein
LVAKKKGKKKITKTIGGIGGPGTGRGIARVAMTNTGMERCCVERPDGGFGGVATSQAAKPMTINVATRAAPTPVPTPMSEPLLRACAEARP